MSDEMAIASGRDGAIPPEPVVRRPTEKDVENRHGVDDRHRETQQLFHARRLAPITRVTWRLMYEEPTV